MVPDALAQHVDGASLRDLALQPGYKLAHASAVLVERQRDGGHRLRNVEERGELELVDAELAVVVARTAGAPVDAAIGGLSLLNLADLRWIAGMAGQHRAALVFEAAFPWCP